ncbi:MAG: hypothetical protein M0R73_02610 [Dehalococcoidia bacterium]|nr:hypothetical protein [Dehalococcoidia bacterium]
MTTFEVNALVQSLSDQDLNRLLLAASAEQDRRDALVSATPKGWPVRR